MFPDTGNNTWDTYFTGFSRLITPVGPPGSTISETKMGGFIYLDSSPNLAHVSLDTAGARIEEFEEDISSES